MRDSIHNLRAKAGAIKYGSPGRSLNVLLVTGLSGKTTTIRFLEAMLVESGKQPFVLSHDYQQSSYDRSASLFYKSLAGARKQKKSLVIVEVTDDLIATKALNHIAIDTVIVTDNSDEAHNIVTLGAKHVVAPSEFSVPQDSIEPYQYISYGEDDISDAKIEDITLYKKGTEVTLIIDHQTKLELATYFAGKANARNLVVATAAAYVLGVDLAAVQEGIAELESPSTAFYWHQDDRPYALVFDNASHEASVLLAVESAKKLTKRRLIVVLDRLYETEIIEQIKTLADRLFIVSDHDIAGSSSSDIDIESSKQAAFDKALRAAKKQDTVLVLGDAFADTVSQEYIKDGE